MRSRRHTISGEIARGLALLGLITQFLLPFVFAVVASDAALASQRGTVICLSGGLGTRVLVDAVDQDGGAQPSLSMDDCDHCSLCSPPLVGVDRDESGIYWDASDNEQPTFRLGVSSETLTLLEPVRGPPSPES